MMLLLFSCYSPTLMRGAWQLHCELTSHWSWRQTNFIWSPVAFRDFKIQSKLLSFILTTWYSKYQMLVSSVDCRSIHLCLRSQGEILQKTIFIMKSFHWDPIDQYIYMCTTIWILYKNFAQWNKITVWYITNAKLKCRENLKGLRENK